MIVETASLGRCTKQIIKNSSPLRNTMQEKADMVGNVCRLAPVTQLVSTGAIGVKYAQQLPLCMMLQTMAFVAFNKVNLCANMYMQMIVLCCL